MKDRSQEIPKMPHFTCLSLSLLSLSLSGVCAACNKPILTKVVNALGCQWHKEHFTCAQCDLELGSTTYYESNGRPYCEKDYHELFAPRCAYCNGPILEVCTVTVYNIAHCSS